MLKSKSPSSISQVLNNAVTDIEKNQNMNQVSQNKEFTIKIVNSLDEREEVFRLAYQVYLDKGFIRKNDKNWLVNEYDKYSETIIFGVYDQNKNLAGSLTLVFEESVRLPAEKIYCQEIRPLRSNVGRVLEVSRLVVKPEYRNSKDILRLLFNYTMIYSYHIKGYTSMVIEVNPRHKLYYKTLLQFDEIGAEKECPGVQNAPAVLLHLLLKNYYTEILKLPNLSTNKNRSLYPYFLTSVQEQLVIPYLKKQVKGMTSEEKMYFGFTESGMSRAVLL